MIELSKTEKLYISEIQKNVERLYKRIHTLEKLHHAQPEKERRLKDVRINIEILKDDLLRVHYKLFALMEHINLDDFPEN